MANNTIKHATIKFEKMDKKGMYVNASSASATRIKIDKNYQEIVNAWKSIEKSFTNLEGKSSGKVKQMFTQAVSAAKAKSNAASKRKSELDSGLKKDVQSYAKTLLDTGTLTSLITALAGGKAIGDVITPEPATPSTPDTPSTPSMPSYKHGESLGSIPNSGKGVRYQGSSNFTDKMVMSMSQQFNAIDIKMIIKYLFLRRMEMEISNKYLQRKYQQHTVIVYLQNIILKQIKLKYIQHNIIQNMILRKMDLKK